jgi:hypothetical protein
MERELYYREMEAVPWRFFGLLGGRGLLEREWAVLVVAVVVAVVGLVFFLWWDRANLVSWVVISLLLMLWFLCFL